MKHCQLGNHLFLCMCLFMHVLTTDLVSAVFNILSLHIGYFLHSQFLIPKYSPILHALSH